MTTNKQVEFAALEDKQGKFEVISFGVGNDIVAPVDAMTQIDRMGHIWLQIDSAATIRNWGTQHGLAQIAANGPTSQTELDAIPFGLMIPLGAIHMIIRVNDKVEDKWQSKFDDAEKKLLAAK
jgi:hypothetical protein